VGTIFTVCKAPSYQVIVGPTFSSSSSSYVHLFLSQQHNTITLLQGYYNFTTILHNKIFTTNTMKTYSKTIVPRILSTKEIVDEKS